LQEKGLVDRGKLSAKVVVWWVTPAGRELLADADPVRTARPDDSRVTFMHITVNKLEVET